MSDHEDVPNATTNDEPVKEIEIEIAGEPNKTVKQQPTSTSIQRKPVKYLTEEEKQSLINDARAGRDSNDFSVKFFKNGNVHITQKKITKSQHLIAAQNEFYAQPATGNQSATPGGVGRPILTNDQLMMEHIIDLESRFTKMAMKHKKLKKRYAELESNIYYEDTEAAEGHVEAAEPTVRETVQDPVRERPSGLRTTSEPVNESVNEPVPVPRAAPRKGRSWRSQLM